MNQALLYMLAFIVPFLAGVLVKRKLLKKQKKRRVKLIEEAARDLQRIVVLENRKLQLETENDLLRRPPSKPETHHMKAS